MKKIILILFSILSTLQSEEVVLLGANDNVGEDWQHVLNRNHDVLVRFQNPYYGTKPLYIKSFELFLETTQSFQWALVDTMDGKKDMESLPTQPYYNSYGNLIPENLPLTAPGLFGTVQPNVINGYNSITLSETQNSTAINKQFFYFLICCTSGNSTQNQVRLRLDTELLVGNNAYIYYHYGYNSTYNWFYQFQPIASEGDTNGNILLKLTATDLSSTIEIDPVTAQLPTTITSYPNPFNNSTTIILKNATGNQKLNLYNSTGQLIKSFDSDRSATAIQQINFSADQLNSGIYYLKCGNAFHKILLIK